MALDATLPNDNTKISEIPDYIRETRQAILEIGGIETIDIRLPNDVEINAAGVTIFTLSSYQSVELERITGGHSGDIAILYFGAGSLITLMHNTATGNLWLIGDPNDMDCEFIQGDSITLLYRNNYWNEINRTLR